MDALAAWHGAGCGQSGMGHRAAATYEGTARVGGYERHRPELTVLCKLVEQHWPSFRKRVEEVGNLPGFVVREFEE